MQYIAVAQVQEDVFSHFKEQNFSCFEPLRGNDLEAARGLPTIR